MGGVRYGHEIKRHKLFDTMHKIYKQQGYIVQHKEIQPLFCNNLNEV